MFLQKVISTIPKLVPVARALEPHVCRLLKSLESDDEEEQKLAWAKLALEAKRVRMKKRRGG